MGLDPLTLIKSLGYAGVWSILFLESGVPFFFFLPGDSLLFTAGFLASQGFLNIWVLTLGGLVAAITGNLLGYEIGRRVGLKLFEKGDSRFLKRKHLEMTQRFYEEHGRMTIIMARFMPIVRTFAPFCAGMVRMPYREFVLYTVAGAFLWVAGLSFLGLVVGEMIPAEQIDHYLLPIIVAIIILSFLPSAWHFYKEKRKSAGHTPVNSACSTEAPEEDRKQDAA